MIHNRLFILFFIFPLLTMSFFISMDGSQVPTIDFKKKNKEELNAFAIENEVHALTPRSKISLQERIKELGITTDSGDFIYTALTSDGSMPARPGDVIKFVTTKIYYAQHKQMPPDSYRPKFMIQSPTRQGLESMLSGLFGPNGLPCAYPDLPTVSYGPMTQTDNNQQAREEDFGLSMLFQEPCNLR